ncbi:MULTISPECIES: IS91 family transposase [unclassified Bradyrhizobium]|uniref:IS91 family transposase n=1 Tax=unclassified Bradyrhizobium TaxID=2631580 RepID=UPI00247AAD76|nr:MULTISPECIES: IS91 family transposase [unclassified Bradyrhizobium]WGS18232.1 IS91 family transposase [Bradyrhizobium sp. ISRA463]WGS21123.1 IS91 family transposase [Bradyrhizobium sp. ISRA463]WGS21126.1 IS91 family transposase [Bradyrhizobium sp. ISRA463]WGS22008.1 IS91 family transposase [Bradyrhizobium sp. ISRA463]WGS22041.1 IS91 family transposase [Bradyrhizobium sp. ISRA463]
MSRPALEVADIFRSHGLAWRQAHAGHISLDQMKVMSAIERCRTAALGGHVARCADCAYTTIAYNSCRNRHCPKCQGAAAKDWLADREAELLPVPYYHVVFTLPAAIADIAYQNKAVVYDLLFKVSAETMLTIAADPKHLGGRIGVTSVLHTWGSALTHHPHVHMIVPGGGISSDGQRWVSCRPGFFLSVRVLSRLFRRLFLEKLVAAHQAGRLSFFGDHAHLAEAQSFATHLAPLRTAEWVVYSKRPFGGPEAVPAYLSRYTHRVAIANSRLIACDEGGVTFKWKDYRIEGRDRYKQMTLATDEFIRRFLIHVLPKGLHRIRHYGLFAKGACAANVARARELLAAAKPEGQPTADPSKPSCPCCGGCMIVIEVFARGATPRHRPTAPMNRIRIDTS